MMHSGWGMDEDRKYYYETGTNAFKTIFGGRKTTLQNQDEINAILYALGCHIPPREIEKTVFKMGKHAVRIYVTKKEEKDAICKDS